MAVKWNWIGARWESCGWWGGEHTAHTLQNYELGWQKFKSPAFP